MLALYYSPGACSMAAHIVLEESGQAYKPQKTVIANGETRTESYLKLNPQGRVPALTIDAGETITENTAILPFLGKRFDLWPTDALGESRALSLIGFFATTVHSAGAHSKKPERYAADPIAHPTIRETGLKSLYGYLEQVDERFAAQEWLVGRYSVVDPYAFVFYVWGLERQLPMKELKHYTAFKDRMISRPAVQRVIADEKLNIGRD